MDSDLEQLILQALTLAQRAPSGDNSQPWDPSVSYSCDGSVILLSIALKLKEIFPQTSDYLNRFAILSLGAFAFNFAQGVGLGTYDLKEVVENEDSFNFYFYKTQGHCPEFSTDDVRNRLTDRSLWKVQPLMQKHQRHMVALFQDSDTALLIKPSRYKLSWLFHMFSVDLVRFLNVIPRHYFFSTLRFGKENISKEGLDPRLFGLGRVEQWFLKILRNHPCLQAPLCLLFAVPMSFVSCWLRWFCSSSILILSREEDTCLDWVYLGMALEKLWLYCTQESIGFHPLGGTFLIYQYAKIPDRERIFSRFEKWLLSRAMTCFSSTNLLNAQKPHICVRVGYFAKSLPSPASLRQPVVASIKQDSNLRQK